jgi:nitrate/nitrite transporter NarK
MPQFGQKPNIANLIIGAMAEIPGYVVGVIMGHYIKRKDSMQVYFIIMVLSLLLFAYGARSPKQNEIILMLGFNLYKMNTSIGFIVVYVYSMEIYPTYCRNTGSSLCLASGRIGALVCPLMYEWLTEATGTYMTYIYFMMGSCVVNMVLVYFLPFETQGKALPEDLESVSLLAEENKIGKFIMEKIK